MPMNVTHTTRLPRTSCAPRPTPVDDAPGSAPAPAPSSHASTEVAGIAERMRPGNGASVLEYVRDLDQAFAIPILSVTEYPGLSADGLRAELGAFHSPQGHVRLGQHPELMAVCEKVAAEAPVRSIAVHHRLYRSRCGRQRPTLGGGCRRLGARPACRRRILRFGGLGRRGTGRLSGRSRRSTCGLRARTYYAEQARGLRPQRTVRCSLSSGQRDEVPDAASAASVPQRTPATHPR